MINIKNINFKKNNLTIILAVITILLTIVTLLMPSKNKIKEIEVKKIKLKKDETIDITVYSVNKNTDILNKYTLPLKEASASDLLKLAVEDITKKYSSDLKLINIYFSDDAVYYEFNTKNLSEGFLKALQMTTNEIIGIEKINLL